MKKNRSSNLKDNMQGEIRCPFCRKGRLIVFYGTTGGASVQCSNCGKFYTANFETMSAEKSGAIKNETLISSRVDM